MLNMLNAYDNFTLKFNISAKGLYQEKHAL